MTQHAGNSGNRRRERALALTTSQVAQALGISIGTVRRWADDGYLRSYRTPGGQRRFSPEAVEAFLATLESRSR